MIKRSVLNSPRLKELKRKKNIVLRNKILLSLFAFLVFLTGLVYLSKWQKLNIENIEITGNKVIETELIKKVVQENLSGRYFWLFPKTNFLIYPKNKIKKELENTFTRLKDISVKIKDAKTLEVTVGERTALYTWCGDILPTGEDIKCYFMDDTGYIFDVAPYFSGDVYLKFFGNAEKRENYPLGTYFLRNHFQEIVSFLNQSSKIGLRPSTLFIKDDGLVDFYLSSPYSLPDGPKIVFKLDSDLNKIFENLQTAITTEPLKSDLKTKYNSLLYIDLRFGNKVYYKFSTQSSVPAKSAGQEPTSTGN